jgi:hypothetical protein
MSLRQSLPHQQHGQHVHHAGGHNISLQRHQQHPHHLHAMHLAHNESLFINSTGLLLNLTVGNELTRNMTKIEVPLQEITSNGQGGGSFQELYKKLRPCLENSKFMNGKDASKWAYPADAEEHYKQILEQTRIMRGGVPYHEGPSGFKGPWIENYFIDHFLNKSLSYFNGMIPLFVQWVDIHVYDIERNDPANKGKINSSIPTMRDMFKTVTDLLRPDVIYLAVSQDDQGLFNQFMSDRPNVLTISAGGFGHIAIPLIKGEVNYTTPPAKFERDVGFFGNLRPRLSRSHILEEFKSACQREHLSHVISPSEKWEKEIGVSKYNLAPRGFGRTSYRLAEIVQIGRVPVYLYDDYPWLPYEGTDISISNYGFSGKMGQLGELAKKLKQLPDDEFHKLQNRVKDVREHFTYEGVIRQIEAFIQDPFGPRGGHLRCVRVPDKDHRKHMI